MNLQTHGTIIYESQFERQKPRQYVFGEQRFYDFQDPVDKHYSYGKKVDKPTESDKAKDHESQNIMMIKNMIDKNIPDTYRVNEYDAPIQVTHSSITASTVDNLQNSSVETVETIEISSSEESGEETDGWSMIGVIFLVAISGVISVLLISLLTFVLKNYLFYRTSSDEGIKLQLSSHWKFILRKSFQPLSQATRVVPP